jgi:NAD(P)-dependent dehydrogenase (short-subunit alcohol dehydrogenase family)
MTQDLLFSVAHEIVIITGVSGQLGAEYAKSFLERGATVCGIDLTLSPSSKALASAYTEKFLFCPADIVNKESLKNTLKTITATFGTPTVLINNAALDSPPSAPPEENGPFEDYPETSWDKVMDVNIKGTFLCCQIFGGAMAVAGRGSIINIASIYGVVAPDQNIYEYRRKRGETFFKPAAYATSKSAILNLTRYLAAYWAKKNVRVNTLTISGVFNHQEQDFLDAYCGRIPIGRMAQADEYNGAVLFLSSTASKYMTGSNLVIDGGWTAI